MNKPTTEEMLLHCLEWLDNIEREIGNIRLVDAKPNNFISRRDMRRAALERNLTLHAQAVWDEVVTNNPNMQEG